MQEFCNSCCLNCSPHSKKRNKGCISLPIIWAIICLIISIGSIVALIFIIKNNLSNNEDKNKINKESRILNYILDNKTYSIKENITFTIIIYNKECNKKVCNSSDIEEIKITNEDDLKILNSIFDDIFNETHIKIKTFNNEDLTVEQNDKILKILENNNIISKNNRKYEILINTNDYNNKYKKRGYSFAIENNTIVYTIAMGEKPNGGYSIKITNIKIEENDDVEIFVEERSPDLSSSITQALTYPIVQIKFFINPNKIKIINKKSGENYPLIIDLF